MFGVHINYLAWGFEHPSFWQQAMSLLQGGMHVYFLVHRNGYVYFYCMYVCLIEGWRFAPPNKHVKDLINIFKPLYLAEIISSFFELRFPFCDACSRIPLCLLALGICHLKWIAICLIWSIQHKCSILGSFYNRICYNKNSDNHC